MSVVIRVEHLSKRYQLGVFGGKTLQDDLQRWWKRVRGHPDPLLEIGRQENNIEGEYIWALRDVSFDVKQGEVLGIVGRNGAGKSTLLKLLSRITAPTSGRIRMRGRVASMLEVGTGFHPELTGRENVYLNGAILGMTKAEVDAKFDEIVAFSGVQTYIDTPVKRYSSGMKVRLAFAVAAHLDPEILVIDEVLAVGDAAFQAKCIGKMSDVAEGGRTVLFVSHRMDSIRKLCSKTMWIDAGTVKEIGPTDQVVDHYIEGIMPETAASEIRLPEDPKKDFQILGVRLLDESLSPKSHFRCDESIIIELETMSRGEIPGLYGYLSLSQTNGTTVLASDSRDFGTNEFDRLAVGRHVHHVIIPKRLLGAGEYALSLSFGSRGNINGFLVDSPGRPLVKFRLTDPVTARGNNRRGVLSTLLEWAQVREAETT